MEMRESVLLVDDEPAVGLVLKSLLKQAGFKPVEDVTSGASALELLERRPFDVVISDIRMPGMDGMTLLREVKTRWPDLPVVMLTAHGTIELAVEAMRAGAADFLLKPIDDEQLVPVLRRVLDTSRPGREGAPRLPVSGGLVGESPAMAEVRRLIGRAAEAGSTVLILGESGTGKELVVEAIHQASARRERPLVKVHCGALSETLIESELFGHEKGAFTGAVTARPGRVELADGGTLFLDEIGDISPGFQVKLLRLLQESEFERVGSSRTRKVDVRFVTATHRDLEAMCREGTFREDLYYRLNVLAIRLPPLRERGDDVRLLARHFLAGFGQASGKPELTIEPGALDRLAAHTWPGNVRELQNAVESLVVWCDGATITMEDVSRRLKSLPPADARPADAAIDTPPPSGEPAPLDSWLDAHERQYILHTLKRCDNNRTLAARLLGISRRALYNKLEKHELL
jgi:DNA-binding NtrC family response regulator